MNGHDTAFSQVTSPILVRVLVIDAIVEIVRQEVLKFNRGPQLDCNPGYLTELIMSIGDQLPWV